MTDPSKQRTAIPLMIHEDGVPHHHDDTCVFWSFCTPMAIGDSWATRMCIVGIPGSRVHTTTRQKILEVLHWDLDNLRAGVHPLKDHENNEFPLESPRRNLAGQRILGGLTAVFSAWKGDGEASVSAHRLDIEKRYYRCRTICDWCWASQTDEYLTYGDWTANANWRGTLCEETLPDPSPWKVLDGYSRKRRYWDVLHILHLGTLRDIVASTLSELLASGHSS